VPLADRLRWLPDRLRWVDHRLRWLDDRLAWVEEPAARVRRLTPGPALAIGLLAVCLYVGWALSWGWPRALVAVVLLVGALVTVARFWFGPPPAATTPERSPAPEPSLATEPSVAPERPQRVGAAEA
jgi:hypothetical protein